MGTPLNTMTLIVEDLLHENYNHSEYFEDIKELSRQLNHCCEILKDLSQNHLSKTVQDVPKFKLSSLISFIAASYKTPSIDLVIHKSEEEIEIVLTAELKHILSNLLSNAFSFATNRVDVRLKMIHPKTLLLCIQDDGVGFSKHILSKLGQLFLSSRFEQTSHLGLGLFITHMLVNSLGGELSFFNNPGAVCVLKLPFHRMD